MATNSNTTFDNLAARIREQQGQQQQKQNPNPVPKVIGSSRSNSNTSQPTNDLESGNQKTISSGNSLKSNQSFQEEFQDEFQEGWNQFRSFAQSSFQAAASKSKALAAATQNKLENFDHVEFHQKSQEVFEKLKNQTVDVTKQIVEKTTETSNNVRNSDKYQQITQQTASVAASARDATVNAASGAREGIANTYENAPNAKNVMWFTINLTVGFLFMAMSVFSLPMLVISPEKFTLSFTLGSMFVLNGVSIMKGRQELIQQMFELKRAPFSIIYFISLIATLYCSLIARSMLYTLFWGALQVGSLSWFLASFVPGGYGLMKNTCMAWWKSVSFIFNMANRASDTRGLLPT